VLTGGVVEAARTMRGVTAPWDTMTADGARDGGAVSRIKIAVLASASTLASVVATEVHGVAIGIMTGCAALAAGAAAWSSATRWNKKNDHHPHVVTKIAGSGLHCEPTVKKIPSCN